MVGRRFALCAALGMAAVLLAGNSVKAQGYFIGYYYPDEKRWSGPRLGTGISHVKDHGNWTPVAGTTPATPAAAPVTPSTSMRVPIEEPASQANLRVIVPHESAQVWFGDYQTKSTGMERVFQSPAINPGSYSYQIKVTYTQGGQPISLERTVTVTPGQSLVVDFRRTVASSATAPAVNDR